MLEYMSIPIVAMSILGCAVLGLLWWGVLDRQKHMPVMTVITVSHGVMLALLIAIMVSVMDCFVLRQDHLGASGLVADDHYTRVVVGLIYFLSTLSLYGSYRYLHAERILQFEYPLLLLMAVGGMAVYVTANDLIHFFMGLELQSLALYVMVGMNRSHPQARESAIKYFILGAVSTALTLYGMSFVYGATGATSFAAIADCLSALDALPSTVAVGFLLMTAGMGFKISAAPFHMWTPDVYEGAPLPVVAFLAVVPKIVAVAFLTRLLYGPFAPFINTWQMPLQILAAASIAVGVLGALAQTNLRRMLAYSTISHMGYILAGVACASLNGVQGVLVYLMLYGFTATGVFTVLLSLRRAGESPTQLQDLAGLSRTQPLTAAALSLFMISLAGLPPCAGFFAKLEILLATTGEEFFALAIFIVLSSVVGAVYYLRVVKLMWAHSPPISQQAYAYQNVHEAGLVILICVLVTLGYIFLPGAILQYATTGARAMFGSGA